METQPWGSQVFEDGGNLSGSLQHAGPTMETPVEVGADNTETANIETPDAALHAKEESEEQQAPPNNEVEEMKENMEEQAPPSTKVEEKEQTSKQAESVEENTEPEKVEHEVAAGDSVENETSTTTAVGQKQLIIPKNCHIPIKQTMTNIFAKSTPKAESQAKQSKPLLDVKANIWMSQQELKRTKQKHAPEQLANQEGLEPASRISELPQPPASWGSTPYIHPQEQAPPKKRGRKPKADKQTVEPVAPTRRVRGKTQPEKPASKDSPSQRTRKYLLAQKKKGSKEIGEETAEVSGTKRKKNSGESVDVERPKKKVKESEKQKKRKSDQQTEETAEEDEAKRRSTETKKRVSRKSAAYHRAYKQCEGSEEEKKAAARKVH